MLLKKGEGVVREKRTITAAHQGSERKKSLAVVKRGKKALLGNEDLEDYPKNRKKKGYAIQLQKRGGLERLSCEKG